MAKTALIVGAGTGLSASLARCFANAGMRIVLAARDTDKLSELCAETGATAVACDVARPEDVDRLFAVAKQVEGTLDTVVYNPSSRVRGRFIELDPTAVANAINITAYGGFLVGQRAAQRMLQQGHGAILFTGASASVMGYAQSAPFAMGKFALRGLAQSMARELAPQNIHVAHFVIDGAILSVNKPQADNAEDSLLDPDAIAQSYLHVLQQHRSAWTWEMELRPWAESF
jgi:NAD(P)-dependent dehydrogenase (short-subunit alcohol dehydrogenase family)